VWLGVAGGSGSGCGRWLVVEMIKSNYDKHNNKNDGINKMIFLKK
jgi:hypothetical protein